MEVRDEEMKCKMCFAEIDETKTNDQWGNFKCDCRIGWRHGPCYTHYDEILKINDALRTKIWELERAWKHSDHLHVKVEEFLSSAQELTHNILIAAHNGNDDER